MVDLIVGFGDFGGDQVDDANHFANLLIGDEMNVVQAYMLIDDHGF